MACTSRVCRPNSTIHTDIASATLHQHSECVHLQDGGLQDTPAFLLKNFEPGHRIPGPAILIDDISTIVVEPKCTAEMTANMDIKVDVQRPSTNKEDLLTECDPVQLAIFSHRWVCIQGQQCVMTDWRARATGCPSC